MVTNKITSVTNGIKVKLFNISAALPIALNPNDSDPKSDNEITQAFLIKNYHKQYPVEIVNPPDTGTNSRKCKDVIIIKSVAY